MPFVNGDARIFNRSPKVSRFTVVTQIGDRGDGHTGCVQIECRTIPVAVGGQHDGAVEWLDRVEVDQTLSRGSQHHPRKIIVLKDCRLFEAPSRTEN